MRCNMPGLSVNINDETAEALEYLSTKYNTTVTETIRRAVGLLKFLEDLLTENPGATLRLVDAGPREAGPSD